jgi:glycine/serine hydroxymethyltransferase
MKNSFANLVLAGGVALGAGNAMAQSNPDNPDGYNTLTSSHTLTTTINGATAKVLTEESDTHLVLSSLQSEGVLSLESRKKLEKIMISVNDPDIAYDNMNRKNSQKSAKDPRSYRSLSVGLPHNAQATY